MQLIIYNYKCGGDKKLNVGERIKERRKELGMNADYLAEKLNVSRSTVFRYEKGEIEKLPSTILEKVALALNTTPAYLMGWSENHDNNDIKIVSEFVKIPILGKIACGDPITAEENIEGYKERPRDDLPSGEVFYLTAQGDSMSPNIPNGSLVLCRKQEDVENGEIAAVLLNGDEETTLKRVRKIDNVIMLEPLNTSYESFIINENNPARIIGRAIEVTAKL